MLTTAEVILDGFWPARCPQLVRDSFFKTGMPSGGGLSGLTDMPATEVSRDQPKEAWP